MGGTLNFWNRCERQLWGVRKGGSRDDLESQGGYLDPWKAPYGGEMRKGKVKRKTDSSLQLGNAGRVCSKRGLQRDGGLMGGA